MPPSPGTARYFTKREVAAELRVEHDVEVAGSRYQREQVHEAALVDGLGHVDADVGQPRRHGAAPAVGGHDDVGVERGAVVEPHAGDDRRPVGPGAAGDEPGDRRAGADLDAGLGQRRRRGAPTRRWCGAR